MNAAHTAFAKLAKVKIELAEKYEHLAKISNSTPRKANWLRKARHYRNVAERLVKP